MRRFIMLFFCFPSLAFALQFTGYSPANNSLKWSEGIERFEETKTEFLILLSEHAALYSFPRTKNSERQVRNFLENAVRTKKKIKAEVDPEKAQIISLAD